MNNELEDRIDRLESVLAVVVRLLEQVGVEFNRDEDGTIIGLNMAMASVMPGKGVFHGG